jgi:hypothetical protein
MGFNSGLKGLISCTLCGKTAEFFNGTACDTANL